MNNKTLLRLIPHDKKVFFPLNYRYLKTKNNRVDNKINVNFETLSKFVQIDSINNDKSVPFLFYKHISKV